MSGFVLRERRKSSKTLALSLNAIVILTKAIEHQPLSTVASAVDGVDMFILSTGDCRGAGISNHAVRALRREALSVLVYSTVMSRLD